MFVFVDLGATSGTTVAGSTSDPGSWSYQFSSPTAITFDQFGYMYVLDFNNDRIQKWFPSASFGVTVAATTLVSPLGFRFDRESNLIIADTNDHRILKFGLLCRKFYERFHLYSSFSPVDFSYGNNHNESTAE